jgi:hypothetical protein
MLLGQFTSERGDFLAQRLWECPLHQIENTTGARGGVPLQFLNFPGDAPKLPLPADDETGLISGQLATASRRAKTFRFWNSLSSI